MDGKLVLQFETRELANHLEISYQIKNSNDRIIYTTDIGIIVQAGGTTVVGFQSRISWEAPNTVVLSTALQPLDPTVARAMPPRAYARRLLPGESVDNKVQLPLPLRATDVLPSDKGEKIVCSNIRFEISTIPDSDTLSAKEQKIGNHSLWLLSADAWREHSVAAVTKISVPVIILVKK